MWLLDSARNQRKSFDFAQDLPVAPLRTTSLPTAPSAAAPAHFL